MHRFPIFSMTFEKYMFRTKVVVVAGLEVFLWRLGASWGGLGAPGGRHGSVLVWSWAMLGRSGGHLGRPWHALGRSGVGLERSCGTVGAIFGESWRVLGILGASCGHLESISSRLGEPKTKIFHVFFNDF